MIYIDYYDKIKENLLKCDAYDRVKDYSKNRNRVITYFENGRILTEAGGKYGDNIIDEYAKKLVIEVGKKYNRRTLFRMKQFYNVFKNEKVSQLATQLTWSHYIELLVIKDKNEMEYYINISLEQKLSRNDLRNKIKNREYKRLSNKTKNKLISKEKLEIEDLVPNPIIIKNNSLDKNISEYVLKLLILDNLDDFLRQLGTGFSYIGNEYKMKVDDNYNYIDLLLFNYESNCFVVVELKITELKKEHIGQIQFYMNYINDNLKKINQNDTIGIIICREDNKYVIKYCVDKKIISRKYELV